MPYFRIGIAQINTTVGNFDSNLKLISEAMDQASASGCHLLVFPEMTIPGYPAEDLLYKKSFIQKNVGVLKLLAKQSKNTLVVVGFADPGKEGLFNAAAFLHQGKIVAVYHKNHLPNYGVFDEKRYFERGDKPLFLDCSGVRLAASICEDIWHKDSFVYQSSFSGKADILINLSASPYHRNKQVARRLLLKKVARRSRSWVVYTNLTGGQDELVFDGGSMVVSPRGIILSESASFAQTLSITDIPVVIRSYPSRKKRILVVHKALSLLPDSIKPFRSIARSLAPEEELYEALVQGTKDYVLKNGFRGVLIGLSGGIDSALVASIAVDSLGAKSVIGVTMPSPYTSNETFLDAKLLAKNLGIKCLEIEIYSIYILYKRLLKKIFKGLPEDATEENLQARIRGNLLMAISNKFGHLVLTTGNKSEMATGYCTLYGDMAGGFSVIKDVPKTEVFALSRWRNRNSSKPWIPKTILTRAPSAELRHNQKDADSLPLYRSMDPIIDAYIEKDLPVRRILALGHKRADVLRAVQLIDRSEYKRRQSPPGIKISSRAFGRDRRMPITNGFSELTCS